MAYPGVWQWPVYKGGWLFPGIFQRWHQLVSIDRGYYFLYAYNPPPPGEPGTFAIDKPSQTDPQTGDWQKLLALMVFSTGGYYMVGFTPHDNHTVPKVKWGSRFELNGSYYVSMEDEDIAGFEDVPYGSSAWVHAVPSSPVKGQARVCRFEYRTTAPVFDVAMGGMYSGAARCIGWLDKKASNDFRIYGVDTWCFRNMAVGGRWRVPTAPLT